MQLLSQQRKYSLSLCNRYLLHIYNNNVESIIWWWVKRNGLEGNPESSLPSYNNNIKIRPSTPELISRKPYNDRP